MSKILFFSDIHFHHTHRFSVITQEGYTVREQEHLSCAGDIIQLLKSKEIDKVVFGGDMYGPVGDAISCQTQCAVIEFVTKLAAACKNYDIPFEMLVGNHDLSKNVIELNINKLAPFVHFDNVKVYSVPTVEGDYVYMPYCVDSEQAETFLKSIPDKENKIVFAHLDLAGINLGNGIFTTKGVSLDLLKQFKMTLEGHYHSGGCYAKNIILSGSTQRLSFKDKGVSRKNIIIYNTETCSIIRENFYCPDWLTFTDDNIEDVLKIDNNNYVKVELSTDILLTPEIKEKLDKVKGKDISIDVNRISVNKQITEEMNSENEQDILTNFVNKSENTEEQKEALIKEGIRLLKAVQ